MELDLMEFFRCRYTDPGAAADAGHEQDHGRGAEGVVRVVGKGTSQIEHNQR